MSNNLFQRLRELVPLPPVLVGIVRAHHDDDTSTVEIPGSLPITGYAGNVAAGSLIRPRGRTVPVGKKAFVRAGVIETQAPDDDPIDIPIGVIILPPPPPTPTAYAWFLDTFTGTGDLSTHTPENGPAWAMHPESPAGTISQFLLDTGTLKSRNDLGGIVPSGYAIPAVDFYIVVDAICSDTAPNMLVEIKDTNYAGTPRGPQFEIGNWDFDTYNVYLDTNDGTVNDTHDADTGVGLGATLTLRIEVRDNGADLRVFVNGAAYYSTTGLAYPLPLTELMIRFTGDTAANYLARFSRVQVGALV